MPENVTRLPSPRTPKLPEWKSVIERFYANSFDASSRGALVESIEAWASMDPDEQSFHTAHLAFRRVQALGDIHEALKGVESGLANLDPKALRALRYLPAVKKALVVIARGQHEMLDLLAEANPTGVAGDDTDPDEGDDDGDDDDGDGDNDDDGDDNGDDDSGDEDSELADAVDAVEVEDHGHGDDVESVEPDEIIPRGGRRRGAPGAA
jgi:hypothetical protein